MNLKPPRARAIFGMLLGAVVAACSSPHATSFGVADLDDGRWTQYERDATHNAVIRDYLPHPAWAVRLGDRTNGTMSYANGTLFVGTFGKRVLALDATSGALKWSAALDDAVMSPPIVYGDRVIVGTGTNAYEVDGRGQFKLIGRPAGNAVYALDEQSGAVRWKFATRGEDMPGGVVVGGRYIFANGDGHAYALDAASGRLVWKKRFGYVTMSSASTDGKAVYVGYCGTPDCGTAALEPSDGRILWQAHHAGGPDCSPTVWNGLVFVDTVKWHDPRYAIGGPIGVDALRARDGRAAWSWRGASAPISAVGSGEYQIAGTVSDGVLYQPIGNQAEIVAFDAASGRELWTLKTAGDVKMNPVAHGPYLYFGDIAGILYVVDRRDGSVVRTQSYQFPFTVAAPMLVGNTLYIANGPMLYAMSTTTLATR